MRYTIKELKVITDASKGIQKLADLEDIEDELGIELITLFKALKNGVYVKGIKRKQKVSLHYNDLLEHYYLDNRFMAQTEWLCVPQNYGKTWALTKEELI